MVSDPQTYSAAQKKCQDLQANLLVVETQDEYDRLARK